MQPLEKHGQLFIIIIDEAYTGTDKNFAGDEKDYEENSEAFRRQIEQEFGTPFIEANVGPGADVPAFLTILSTAQVPLWTLVLSAFFMGKKINENLDAWRDIGKKVRSFFSREVVLSRHGAAVLAVERVFDEMGGTPKSIELLSYQLGMWGDEEKLDEVEFGKTIDEAGDILYLGMACHLFEIVADGVHFRVGVQNTKVTLIRVREA